MAPGRPALPAPADAAAPALDIYRNVLVERWFRQVTEKAIRRGVFHSVTELIEAIETFLAANNHDPKPCVWTASADAILAKVSRCKAVLETVH